VRCLQADDEATGEPGRGSLAATCCWFAVPPLLGLIGSARRGGVGRGEARRGGVGRGEARSRLEERDGRSKLYRSSSESVANRSTKERRSGGGSGGPAREDGDEATRRPGPVDERVGRPNSEDIFV
jgi:hypothetical protein